MSDYRYAETDWKAKVFFIRFPKSYMDRTKAERWANDRRREGFTVASTKKGTYCIAHYILPVTVCSHLIMCATLYLVNG